MIVVCTCGQKSRIRDISKADRVRCGGCKQSLVPEVTRQAARNADIVLDITAILAHKEKTGRITGEEMLLAQIIAKHELGGTK